MTLSEIAAVLGVVGGGGVLGLLAKLVAWSIAQDRRIEAKAGSDRVEALEKLVNSAAATRIEVCAGHRQKMDDRFADLERETSARLARQDSRLAVLLERLDGLRDSQDEIRQMLRTLFEREGLTPPPAKVPKPIKRQRTGEIPESDE